MQWKLVVFALNSRQSNIDDIIRNSTANRYFIFEKGEWIRWDIIIKCIAKHLFISNCCEFGHILTSYFCGAREVKCSFKVYLSVIHLSCFSFACATWAPQNTKLNISSTHFRFEFIFGHVCSINNVTAVT